MDEARITREQLGEILRLKDQAARRDVDAATCGTPGDWDRADKADRKLDEAIEELFKPAPTEVA